jgi:hypothetical protein
MTDHSRMPRPKAPRMAPTAMKTVPSGKLDCCMNGAFFVGGTVGAGYSGIWFPIFVSDGNPVGFGSVLVAAAPVMTTSWRVVVVELSEDDSGDVDVSSVVVVDLASDEDSDEVGPSEELDSAAGSGFAGLLLPSFPSPG